MANPRMRLKLTIPGATGTLALVLRIFSNALTFIGRPTPAQMELVTTASLFLGAFGVLVEVTPSD